MYILYTVIDAEDLEICTTTHAFLPLQCQLHTYTHDASHLTVAMEKKAQLTMSSGQKQVCTSQRILLYSKQQGLAITVL